MVGFLLISLAGVAFYFLLQPPHKAEETLNHSFQKKYLLDVQKLGYQKTGEKT